MCDFLNALFRSGTRQQSLFGTRPAPRDTQTAPTTRRGAPAPPRRAPVAPAQPTTPRASVSPAERPQHRPPNTPGSRPGRLPVTWVTTSERLVQVAEHLLEEPVIALDVETRIPDQRLALVQIGTADRVYLIDPLAVRDLSPLAPVLASEAIDTVIHNASFEKRILGKHGLGIGGVVDTLAISRRFRGRKIGKHTLQAVCARELSVQMDKGCQTSNWMRRPLSRAQVDYAALDVEVLIALYAHFGKLGALQMQPAFARCAS